MKAKAARSRRAGGASTVDQMSEGSFPASDPPAVWTWETNAPGPHEPAKKGPGPSLSPPMPKAPIEEGE